MSVVTISRGTHSGGVKVAEKVAELLGHTCVSREMLNEDAANDFGVTQEHLDRVVNEAPKPWQQAGDYRLSHLNIIRAALLRRSKDGRLVFHGYAGHLLLEGVSGVLRVRAIASDDYRINAAMKDLNIDKRAAMALVKQDDKESVKWSRWLYGIEWSDPSLYDLVINLERIGIDTAVQTIVQMAKAKEFAPDDKFYQTFGNQMLSSMVWCSLAKADLTTASDVSIGADDGVVTVSGTAQSDQQVENIIEVARKTEGVKDVVSKMRMGAKWYW